MPTAISHTMHKSFEALGPPGNHVPYLDMHENDGLCWQYTAAMVVLQVLAYGKVSDNREERRDRAAARKLEKEKERAAALARGEQNGSALNGKMAYCSKTNGFVTNGINGHGKEHSLHMTNTNGSANQQFCDGSASDSTYHTDTSDEEVIV